MYSFARRHLCQAALLCWFSSCLFAATPTTYLYLDSQPGDYIGQGITRTYTATEGTFLVNNLNNGSNAVSVTVITSTDNWNLDFASPLLSPKFARGQYIGAQRTAFRGPTRPGIDVSGDGRGCNTVTGQFLVSDFALAPDGTVARLAVDFEQHCEGFPPALYGSIRYNSGVSQVSRLGVGNTYTLKGNAETSDSFIPVALSIPSQNVVTVQYATLDATAVQGVDYVASSGMLTFPAGSTSESIVVPILGDRQSRGNKKFKVALTAPAQALLGVPSASVLIRDPNVSQTVLAMNSQPGDFIGQGQQYLITQSDAVFKLNTSANVITMSEQNGDYWGTDFAGPTTARLTAGEYLNVQRYPFQPSGTPGLSVSGVSRGCNTLTGNFDVLKAVYKSGGALGAFSANFEQHCEGLAPALFGWVRFHSLLEQFSVTDAMIQGSSAVFTVTLNPSLASSVSVTFSTADGSAIAGVDYTATTQTLTFSPGMLQQTITVPLLSPGNVPKKTFYGQLSSPSGAAVWVSQGPAAF